MTTRSWAPAVAATALALAAACACAQEGPAAAPRRPAISFVAFDSPDLTSPSRAMLKIKAKLSQPHADAEQAGGGKRPAVVILHGSSGVDARGDFYEAALNAAGIATLQIDMWEARGVTGVSNRPPAPVVTYPDAFSALAFLAAQPGIDPERIGVLGFSWGGVVSLASAERLYAGQFGGGRRFAAHVAHYPVCYGFNNTSIAALQPLAQKGAQLRDLTGAPVLVQIGSNDGYDNGTEACQALAAAVNATNGPVVQVNEYPGAYHAWDRLMVPIAGQDPFADRGSFFTSGVVPSVQIVPDVEQARLARERVVSFFKRNLQR